MEHGHRALAARLVTAPGNPRSPAPAGRAGRRADPPPGPMAPECAVSVVEVCNSNRRWGAQATNVPWARADDVLLPLTTSDTDSCAASAGQILRHLTGHLRGRILGLDLTGFGVNACKRDHWSFHPIRVTAMRNSLARVYAQETMTWVRQALELSELEVGKAVQADRKTIQRWRAGVSAPHPEHRQRLEQLNQLRHLLEQCFRSPGAAQQWLHRPGGAFGGRTPFSLLTSGDLTSLIQALSTLAAGAHV